MSYSCGKDSTLALHKMLAAGHTPLALLVMFDPEAGRSYFHGADDALLARYAEALQIPLLPVRHSGGDVSPFHGGGAARGEGAGRGGGLLR